MKINKPLAIPKKPIILINHGWQVADAENKNRMPNINGKIDSIL
jgi:hypothetical protein